LSRETKGNGTFTTYTYDLAGQLTALTNYASGAPTFLSALDDHTSHGDKNVHAPQADKNVGAPILSFFHYTYDAKGNRLTMTTAAGVTRYDYDPLNQLTGVTYPGGRHVTYAYDADGNRTNRHSTLNPQLSTSYFYDTENRLVRVSTPTNGVFQYTYDALGNRTAVVHDGVTNRFLHDPVGLVDVAAEYDATGALVSRYDHGIGLVSRTDGAGNSAFYSFDALGNTRELTGDAGSLLHSYDYDAFGAATVANEAVANSYRFVGRYGVTAEAADLTLMRARYYDRNLGRFMSIDPIRLFDGRGNLQSYCLNNPVRFVDPTGLKTRTGFDWGEFFSNLAES
jgi:RHS repeat-associated protein